MKTKFYLLMGVTALVCLTGCKREPKASVNPTYDPDANTVNTQFVLNISTANGNPDTKQTAVDVQASPTDFRGITDAHILTYNLGYSGVNGAHYMYKVSDNTSKAERDYDLKDLATTKDIITSGNEENHSRIIELALPLGTNAILLYGRAPTTGTEDQQGAVKYEGTALNKSLDNVSFKLKPRLANSNSFTQFGKMMGGILTFIMNAGRYNQTNDNGNAVVKDNSYKFWWPVDASSKNFSLSDAADAHAGYTLYSGSKKWKDYGDAFAAKTPQKALEDVMGEAYYQVMTLQGSSPKEELRAAASVTVVRMVNDMYNIISRVLTATPTTPEEYVAMLVAGDALTRASAFFDYDETSQEMNYRALGTIMDGVDAYVLNLTSDDLGEIKDDYFYYKKNSATDTRTEYAGFPKNLNLPIGAAIMSFVTKNKGTDNEYNEVVYASDIPAYGMGGGSFKVEDYRYPAEITYYVNSPIRTANTAVEKTDYPKLPANWVSPDYWDTNNTWKYDEVLSTTRSVAVEKTINYGTALLKSQFAYSAGTLQDNNGGVHDGESNNSILVNSVSKFDVTGIIIGGISDEVGWDFTPKSTSTFKQMVFDNLDDKPVTIPVYSGDPTTLSYSSPVYTCTWDNYNPSLGVDAQSKVYIGLELVNNSGSDIWGELNMIRNGGTFYLVGELDPYKEGAAKNFMKNDVLNLTRSDCFYPPFDENGATINAPRVFMQDYVTNVKFLFTPNSLKHAYVTMPDLRAGQVSLGLSVDLSWEPGMEFTVNMGETSPTE